MYNKLHAEVKLLFAYYLTFNLYAFDLYVLREWIMKGNTFTHLGF